MIIELLRPYSVPSPSFVRCLAVVTVWGFGARGGELRALGAVWGRYFGGFGHCWKIVNLGLDCKKRAAVFSFF